MSPNIEGLVEAAEVEVNAMIGSVFAERERRLYRSKSRDTGDVAGLSCEGSSQAGGAEE